MNANRISGRFAPFLLLLLLWLAAFSIACRVAEGSVGESSGSMLADVMGTIRIALGGEFIGQADRWFHKGVGHYHSQGFENVFTRLQGAIRPSGHVHLHGEGVGDVIPPLYFASKMDPSNVDAYALAAFLLAREAGRPDLADAVLCEAQRHNPRDYRIYYERGKLALKAGSLDDAARLLDASLRLWPAPAGVDDEDARSDLAGMLTYRGLLFEMGAAADEAAALYSRVLDLFPGRQGLRDRIAELNMNGRAKASPSDVWKMMLFHHPLVCGHEDGHD